MGTLLCMLLIPGSPLGGIPSPEALSLESTYLDNFNDRDAPHEFSESNIAPAVVHAKPGKKVSGTVSRGAVMDGTFDERGKPHESTFIEQTSKHIAGERNSSLAAANGQVKDEFERLRGRLDSLRREHDISGLAVSVVGPDSTVWSAGLGLADREEDEPVTPHTLFRVGSTTKTFVALGLMRLVGEGKVSLDDPVREIAPELPIHNPWAETDPVRVVHLLEHTAGLDDMHFKELFNTNGTNLSPLDGLTARMDRREVRWRPGTRHSYSNPGYAMAGHLIEKITGRPFDDYLKSTLLDSLRMKNSSFTLSEEIRRRMATPYGGSDFEPLPAYPLYLRPAGSLISSADEMSNMVRMLLNRGSFESAHVVNDTTLARMERPESSIGARRGLTDWYGKGLYTLYIKGWKMRGHDGGMPGFQASMRYSPELDRGFVILINGNGGMGDLREAVTAHIARDTSRPAPPEADLKTDELRAFTGYYEHRNPRNEFLRFVHQLLNGAQVTLRDDSLYIQKGLFGSP